ncbi:MAG: hypothetical protein ACOWW1_05455 [archaeon]
MSTHKLPIAPLNLGGTVKKVEIKDIKPGHKIVINFPKAVVAYLDVLGFSKKRTSEDIRLTLLDFSSPLALAAARFQNVRFNVFSDCAFVATTESNADNLLSALRYAFTQWTFDGILVRGGISLGKYSETESIAISHAPANFVGNLFGGSGVFNAVKLEHYGTGAFLFTNKKCSDFFKNNYREPTYFTNRKRFLGWSDNPGMLSGFLGISLWRLIRIKEKNVRGKNDVINHLTTNILYALQASNSPMPFSFLLAVLSHNTVKSSVKSELVKLFKINDPADFNYFKKITAIWLNHPDFKMNKVLAEFDSSI